MADTVNSAGVLCYPTLEADRGWTSIMPGFTDDCFPAEWIRVELPAGQPAQWGWLDTPGVVCSTTWGFTADKRWNYTKRIGLVNTSVIIRFTVGQVPAGPFAQATVDLAFIPDFGLSFFQQFVFDINQDSKKTPWVSSFCHILGSGNPCTSTGKMTLDWWPSSCGVPAPGPTVPA